MLRSQGFPVLDLREHGWDVKGIHIYAELGKDAFRMDLGSVSTPGLLVLDGKQASADRDAL